MLGGSLRYTNGKALGSNEVIKLGYTVGKLLGTILGNVDGITLELDVGIEMGSLYRSFDGDDDNKLEGILL